MKQGTRRVVYDGQLRLAASVLILGEPFTWRTGVGTALTLAGLLLSQRKAGMEKRKV